MSYNKEKRIDNERRYGKHTDPGISIRAKKLAAGSKMPKEKPNGGVYCKYYLPTDKGFCTEHKKHH